jgi:predicted nucleotidyltransferase
MYYNYEEEIKADVLDAIRDFYTAEEIRERMEDRERWAEELYDDLWVDDSVTGNASGSYTFDRYTAREYVTSNMELLKDAFYEFGVDSETIAEKLLDEDWEYCDVTIRCYLLNSAIWAALDEIAEEIEEAEEGGRQ